jgi:hypothetical protein
VEAFAFRTVGAILQDRFAGSGSVKVISRATALAAVQCKLGRFGCHRIP